MCLPALDEAPTIAAMVRTLCELCREGLIDEVLVFDGGSGDGTPEVAAAAGADVYGWRDVRPDLGPTLGKGDSMWRALQRTRGEIVCFLDADLISFERSYVAKLVAPLVGEEAIGFVKSTFERPLGTTGASPGRHRGGRVTEAVGRPLLALLYPELTRFRQPLSGQIAARRSLLEALPFAPDYGVDAGLLIDAHRTAGSARLAEVDLGELWTVHQDDGALQRMAGEVARAIVSRAVRDGIELPAAARRYELGARSPEAERPPISRAVRVAD